MPETLVATTEPKARDDETRSAASAGAEIGSKADKLFGGRVGLPDLYVALALGVILFARFVPFNLFDGVSRCTFRLITSVPCLGCGFTRAFVRSAHFDIAGAWLVSPLGTTLFLSLVAFSVFGVIRLAFGLPWPRFELSTIALKVARISLVLVLVANWVYLLVRHFVIGDWA